MEGGKIEEIVKVIKSEPVLSPLEFQNQVRRVLHSAQEDFDSGSSTKKGHRFFNPQQKQLPEGLEELFFRSNCPAEGLNTATELIKSVQQSESKDSSERDWTLKITKLLVDRWMSQNCCAEAFVRYSVKPCGSAETTNFSRNLFSLPDNFGLSQGEFPRFIFQQVLLAVSALSRLIREEEEVNYEVRTSSLSSAVDRLFLRFFVDEEKFYPYFDSEGEIVLKLDGGSLDPFLEFVLAATELSEEDFIARRLLGKIFLALGLNPVSKICRVILLLEGATNGGSPATRLLYPAQEFLSKSQIWRRNLIVTVPLKSRVENFRFYSPWAQFMTQELGAGELFGFWKTLINSWTQIMSTTSSDSRTLTSTTCALIALAKSLRVHEQQLRERLIVDSNLLCMTSVFQGVQKCLGTTDELKQGCGMVVGQVMSDLVNVFLPKTCPSAPSQPEDTGNVENPESSSSPQDTLRFESKNSFFLKCVAYYEDQGIREVVPLRGISRKELVPRNFYTSFGNVDSDDEEEEEKEGDGKLDEDDEESEFQPFDMSNDTPLNEATLNLKSLGRKVPNYFSEICEVLMEAHGSKDEAAQEVLKRMAVMKIPILLFHKVAIESTVAKNLARVLSELEGDGILEIPIICGLYELSNSHPDLIFPTMASIAFDKEHHSVGHRMVVLARYCEVAQLLSRQKCFSCFSEKTGKLAKILEHIHAPFIRDYLQKKQLLGKCKSCGKIEGAPVQPPKAPIPIEKELDQALTWREVIERRVAAKTRRFASSSSPQGLVEKLDEYSGKLVPIIWASLANKLGDRAGSLLVGEESSEYLSSALFTAQVFRTLGIIVLGTAGIMCPHLRNLAAQTADLVSIYSHHKDAQVRRAVLSLLAMIISSSEGKEYILEMFVGKSNVFEGLTSIFEKDPDSENRRLFSSLYQLVSASALVQMGRLLSE